MIFYSETLMVYKLAWQFAALAQLKEDDKAYTKVQFAKLDGDCVDYKGKHLQRSDRAYFKDAVSTGKPVVAKPFIGETTKK